MIRYLIKNNLKILFRYLYNPVVFILAPLGVMVVLSSAFSQLLKKYEAPEEMKVGYRMEAAGIFASYLDELVEAGKEADIHFVSCPEGEPAELMEKNDLGAFVVFKDDAYQIYQSEDHLVEGMAAACMIHTFVEQFKLYNIGMTATMVENGITAAGLESGMSTDQMSSEQMSSEQISSEQMSSEQISTKLMSPEQMSPKEDEFYTKETLPYLPDMDAMDYYGKIETVYFGWCAIVCAAPLLISEKKNKFHLKFHVADIPGWKMYLAKYIPTVLFVCISCYITVLLSAVLLEVKWGINIESFLVLTTMLMAAPALGYMFYSLTNSTVLSLGMTAGIVWFAGFFGGSFETYILSNHPMSVKLMDPIYHGNRALVELSCLGHSDYTVSSILFRCGMVVVCSFIACGAETLRKRGRA